MVNFSLINSACHETEKTPSLYYISSCRFSLFFYLKLSLLSSKVFKDQPEKEFDTKVFVRVEDVAGLIVSAEFISNWKAHFSSVMNIYRAGVVVFPPPPIPYTPFDSQNLMAGEGIAVTKCFWHYIIFQLIASTSARQ